MLAICLMGFLEVTHFINDYSSSKEKKNKKVIRRETK